MVYVKLSTSRLPLEVKTELTSEEHADTSWENSWDWKSFEEVQRLASYLTAMTGKTYLAVDRLHGVSPRFDVIEAPKVGDPVSYSFNGDSYPCGVITKITKGWRVTTSEGAVFNRFKATAGWRRVGGTWWMISGHHYEQNPHV